MALRCPSGQRIFTPVNPGGQIVITQNDLNITETEGLDFFFSNDDLSPVIPVLIDDANGTTVWTPDNAGNDPTRFGSLTNTGNTITYTQGAGVQEGDCLTIHYWVDNFQGTDDDDCDNTFELCFGADQGGGGDPTISCANAATTVSAGNLPATFTGSDFATSDSTNLLEVGAIASTLVDGNPVPAGITVVGGELRVDATVAPGNYVFRAEIVQFVNNQRFSTFCTSGITVTAGDGVLSCTNRTQWQFNNTPFGIAASELGANGVAPYTIDRATVFLNGAPAQNVTVNNERISFDANAADGAYGFTYTLRDANGDTVTCANTRIINVETGGGTSGGGVGIGVGGPQCQNSSWVNGSPTLNCGDGPMQYQINLRDANNNPVTQPVGTINFGLIGLPAGGQVNGISNDGGGNYTVEIDLSNVNCAGTVDASLAYSLT